MSSHKAPQGYQPTGQGAADQGFQQNVNYLSGVGQDLSKSVIPQLQGVTNSVVNNPYYPLAQQGADQAAAIGSGFVAPAEFYGASQDMLGGDAAFGAAGTALGQGQDGYTNNLIREGNAARRTNQAFDSSMAYLPMLMAGYGDHPDLVTGAQSYADQLMKGMPAVMGSFDKAQTAWDESQQLLPYLLGGIGPANQILNTGFDPQKQLYDRTYQQQLEHINAVNSQNGVSGSPFAAGVTSDALKNFDIDWQNNQLGREAQALGAYDSATSTAAGNFNSIMSGGAGTYGSLLNSGVAGLRGLTGDANTMMFNAQQGQFQDQQTSQNNAVANYTAMLNSAMGAYGTGMGVAQGFGNQAQTALNSGYNNFGNMMGLSQNSYANASDLGAAGLNTLTTAAMYPNQVYMNNQEQILQALQAQIQGTNASMGLTQDAINDYGNYMKIGQNATQLAQNATSINNAASQATWQGIGQLAGLALAPFTGGTSLLATAGAGAKPPGGG